ncbi:autotransporter domain-containing protein [Rhizobium metallidurans]|uniref:Outer membrane autotransporter protein n=1 Tax=Rhizobium metallidurans TaxID=1265931 RepID=A0A7W6CVJ1_9HYPH|nr:autotransporter domain-containing protein [Rhizobium metallidurans]MBB3967019.1 outer membrane autotransporter protein [Rhizobium metallidurans]
MKPLLPALLRRLGLFTALVSAVAPTHALAQSAWSGGGADNEFSNGSNWTPAAPGAGDLATVDTGSPQVTDDVTVGRLDVDGGNVTVTDSGTLTTTSETTISSGSVSINSGGVVNSDVSLNGGSLSLDGHLNGRLNLNNGNVTVNGTLGRASVATGTALSNNGATGGVDVSAGATFVNNSGATVDTVTNAGTTSNAGTVGSLTNTAGNFTNNAGGTVTGTTTVSGGTVTNNFIITDADVAAVATFVNNQGATAGAIRNSGTVTNAGTIASVQNDAGTFTNNAGGIVTGTTTISGGDATNNARLSDVNVGMGGTFTNAAGATAGAVANAGTTSNAGTIASLTNTAGTFTNNADGKITGQTAVEGGTVTNNFVITDADVTAVASFVNNQGATAGAIRNSGTVTNAGTIASIQNDDGTFTNNAGGIVTGSATVNGGSVTNNASLNSVDVGAAGAFTNATGANAGAVTNAGTTSNAGTVASLTNTAGTFTNNAGGTITGQTTIDGGTVTNNFVITDADVAAVATFVNNQGATAGAIRNSGTVTNAGMIASIENDAGTFTNNTGGTVTGATSVNGGRVVNNATLAGVAVAATGTFVNNSGAVAGTVTNSGTAANDGTITALQNNAGTFSNTGTITGAATVSGGSLINDGTIAGAVDVDSGGLLSGSGSVGGLLVNAGGVLAPGSGIATLGVNGDVTFRAGSTYQVDITADGLSDSVDATGAVFIEGGTLAIKAAAGRYATNTSYTILTAGSITGSFDAVSSDFAFLSPTLIYDATSIDMQLDRNSVQFADVANTANGRATAAAVEALGLGNTVYDAVLPLDATTANGAFTQLSGEVHASLKSTLLWESRFPRDAILDEIAAGLDKRDDAVRFWTSGYLSSSTWSGDGDAAGIDVTTNGVVFGADAPIAKQWRIGGIVGYGQDSFSQANTDSYHAGLYAIGEIGQVTLAGGAIYSRNEASTRRDISFGTFSDRLTADYASATSQVFADVSWTHEVNGIKLQPFANLAYVSLDSDGFRENGGDAALSASSDNDAITATTLGLRWSMDWLANEVPITLSGTMAWRHLAGDVTPRSSLAFAGGSPFIIEAVEMPRDSLVAQIGVSAKLSKSSRLTLSYSGEFGKGLQSSAARINFEARF